jgi:hypothetical protein
VSHQRTLEYDQERFVLGITDQLACRGPHRVELNWHFAPQCEVRRSDGGVVAELAGVRLTLSIDPRLACRLESACETPPGGWFSQSYDAKVPATTVSASGDIQGSTTFVTEIRIELP